MAVRSRIRIETLFKSTALAIAAAAITLMLFLLVPSGVDSQSPKDPQGAQAPQAGPDNFTVSTTEELVSTQTWRSRYAVPVSLGVLIVAYSVAYRRINRADRSVN